MSNVSGFYRTELALINFADVSCVYLVGVKTTSVDVVVGFKSGLSCCVGSYPSESFASDAIGLFEDALIESLS